MATRKELQFAQVHSRTRRDECLHNILLLQQHGGLAVEVLRLLVFALSVSFFHAAGNL